MTQLTWFVTGCSSGFGEHFVHSILARGDRVIASARKGVSRLQHLKDAGAAILELDVCEAQNVLSAKMEEALKIYGGIDVLVNNAGFCQGGTFEEVSTQEFHGQFDTNFFGALNVTRSILPHFRQKYSGTVVFISSYAGFCSHGGFGAYSSSKAALNAAAESLRQEIAMFGSKSIVVESGNFATKALEPTSLRYATPKIPDYTQFNEAIVAIIEGGRTMVRGDAKKAVERIIDLVKSEGMASGRAMPVRLPLGSDALAAIRAKCKAMLEVCDEWETLISSANGTTSDHNLPQANDKSSENDKAQENR